MRLLSLSHGSLTLTPDVEPTETYAILSHTWGSGEEEVTIEDLHNKSYRGKAGYRKIDFCLQQAQVDGLKYVWIDTCCIDKRDPIERGKAINRMFEWYANAAICYVYLVDIVCRPISRSRWFTRGWTLQELLAPNNVRFYSGEGQYLGDRATLREEILDATSIDTAVDLTNVPLIERYRWSLLRQTSEPEDASYCLLGLLEIKLLFNYGEGYDHAKDRLLQTVEKEHGLRVGRLMRVIDIHRPQPVIANTPDKPHLTSETLLKSLEFEGMYLRRADIKDPFPDTCKWILSHSSYRLWCTRQSRSRFLWIKGHPGTGKSTLIKFIDQQPWNAAVIKISFYFNARGGFLEKCAVGMYRSLLLQVLVHNTYLHALLIAFISDIGLDIQSWTAERLQTAVKFCVQHLSSPVQCFVDGLDECETSEVQGIVYFLESLCQDSLYLFICFASRHYPTISIPHSAEILLDSEQHHSQDLEEYINNTLEVDRNAQGDALKRQVVTKAKGIFFWAILVIPMLNAELRTGSIYNVHRRLEELPSQLSDLLGEIVSRDTIELPRFRLCLQWILFARRPLNLQEYYLGMMISLSDAGLADTSEYSKSWTNMSPTFDQMKKFVSSSSRGLAEVVAAKYAHWPVERSTVQFIHESVRDFLLQHGGLQKLHAYIDGDVRGWVHENLRHACQRYLDIDFTFSTLLIGYAVPLSAIPRTEWRYNLKLHGYYPFLAYAMDNVIHHADQAASSRKQDHFSDEFDVDVFKILNNARMMIEAIPPRIIVRYELMHILAYFNAARLIRNAHARGFDVDDSKLGVTPLSVAIMHDNIKAARELLDCGADVERVDTIGDTPLFLAIRTASSSVKSTSYGEAKFLDSSLKPILQLAIKSEAEECVKLLLQYGAKAEARNRDGETAFSAALDNPATFAILLNHNANAAATYRCVRSLGLLNKDYSSARFSSQGAPPHKHGLHPAISSTVQNYIQANSQARSLMLREESQIFGQKVRMLLERLFYRLRLKRQGSPAQLRQNSSNVLA